MKLRKIGNSLGVTFRREILAQAGLGIDDTLKITAANGEIRIKRTDERITLELTPSEAQALLDGKNEGKGAAGVLGRLRKLIGERG